MNTPEHSAAPRQEHRPPSHRMSRSDRTRRGIGLFDLRCLRRILGTGVFGVEQESIAYTREIA